MEGGVSVVVLEEGVLLEISVRYYVSRIYPRTIVIIIVVIISIEPFRLRLS